MNCRPCWQFHVGQLLHDGSVVLKSSRLATRFMSADLGFVALNLGSALEGLKVKVIEA